MKKYLFVSIIFLFIAVPVFAETTLAQKLSGRILLQVESYGRAWYVYPKTGERYYLKNGTTAYKIMSSLGLGITNADLEKIPTHKGSKSDWELSNRLKGRIVLQVEEHGEAWYINPADGVRYYMKDGDAAYRIMRSFALGITNKNLELIPVNSDQLVPDTPFTDVAYTHLNNGIQSNGYNDETILPLASLTKLMTALVLLDTKPDWDRKVTITQEHINYPVYYVGSDPTSEVSLTVGDTVSFYDLWVAMLLASSNQASAALVDASGFSVGAFTERMNKKARDLGLTKTIFYDIAGLDAHNAATAKEMAQIAKMAFDMPIISEITRLNTYTMYGQDGEDKTKLIRVTNRNYSLMEFRPDAAKTGYLIEAERNVALKKGSKVIVILHALSMRQRNSIIALLLQ